MRLGLLLTPAAVQRLRQYRPARANLGQRRLQRRRALLRYLQRLAQPRVGPGQRLGRALGAPRSPQCLAQLTAQPRVLLAQVPDLHTQRHHRATLSRFHMGRGQQLRQTLYLRLQGQRVLRRAPDRLSFLAGLDQLVSIGFEQSLQGTNLAARDDLRLAPLIGAGFVGLLDPR